MKFNSKKILDNAKHSAIVAVAGAGANALVDVTVQSVEALAPITAEPLYLNLAKVAAGAVLSASTKSGSIVNYAGAGLATVGASNIAASLMEKYFPNAKSETESASGVPFIGKVRMGQRGFRHAAVRGTGMAGTAFMGK